VLEDRNVNEPLAVLCGGGRRAGRVRFCGRVLTSFAFATRLCHLVAAFVLKLQRLAQAPLYECMTLELVL
jgi:hypothetical protein